MSHEISVLDANPEWDEPGFTVVHPARQPSPRLHDYDPGWDYEMLGVGRALPLAVLSLMASVDRAAQRLGLGSVRVFFTSLEDEEHVARYINGTHVEPMIAIDPKPFEKLSRGRVVPELSLTLLHELGHAFLDALGAQTFDEEEEEVVEEFAQTGNKGVLDSFVLRVGRG
jgi:hypothetical protein